MPIIALSGLLSNFANFNIQDFLITILILCISLSFHERTHAWAAYKLGDDTAALQGRLSLNPLVHLDPIGSLVFIISSLSGAGGIGWAKPVPINPTRFDRKYSMKKGIVLTSVAGPLANLALATVSIIIYYLFFTLMLATGIKESNWLFVILIGSTSSYGLFIRLYMTNVILAVFNLLPFPPLDGYKVFGAALPGSVYYKVMQYERYIGIAFLFLIFFGRGILSAVLSYIVKPFNFIILQPIDWLFTSIWKLTGLA